jgi:hypothetical protein
MANEVGPPCLDRNDEVRLIKNSLLRRKFAVANDIGRHLLGSAQARKNSNPRLSIVQQHREQQKAILVPFGPIANAVPHPVGSCGARRTLAEPAGAMDRGGNLLILHGRNQRHGVQFDFVIFDTRGREPHRRGVLLTTVGQKPSIEIEQATSSYSFRFSELSQPI